MPRYKFIAIVNHLKPLRHAPSRPVTDKQHHPVHASRTVRHPAHGVNNPPSLSPPPALPNGPAIHHGIRYPATHRTEFP